MVLVAMLWEKAAGTNLPLSPPFADFLVRFWELPFFLLFLFLLLLLAFGGMVGCEGPLLASCVLGATANEGSLTTLMCRSFLCLFLSNTLEESGFGKVVLAFMRLSRASSCFSRLVTSVEMLEIQQREEDLQYEGLLSTRLTAQHPKRQVLQLALPLY
jgi:hypothetical protein